MSTKVATVITVTDGLPKAHYVGTPGEAHEVFRQIKKQGLPGVHEVYELNATGIAGRFKFKNPPPVAKPRGRPKKTD